MNISKRLRNLYRNITNKYPSLDALFRQIVYIKYLNSIKRKVHGDNNIIIFRQARLSSVLFDINGNGNTIEIMDNCVLKNVTFYIRGDGHKVLIKSGCRFKRGGEIWVEDNECSLSIGEYSTFENVHIAITEPKSKITIGKDCMFAYDIDIRTGDSHSIISVENNERINFAEDISIGNHVWVGAHCMLLKGSIISDDSIVATGSIVTKKFNSNGIIIAGNPAKEIKNNITWSRKRIYK